ncbi:MAG: DMT family transporter, partial [Lachnospiraceae bacterium]|nr:DMT family transporter [Lachnospiraceae bacterium]
LILIAAIFSGPKLREMGKGDPEEKKTYLKNSVYTGLVCGVLLFGAVSFQQFGLLTTSAGKAGFLTALYIIMVPVVSVFLGKKAGLKIWLSVALALFGMYLLCIKSIDDLYLQKGDFYVIMCAVVFTFHILVIDKMGTKGDGVIISMTQFLVCGFISLVLMFIFEEPTMESILEAKIPLLYAGLMSGGIAYTLQIIGQNKVQPSVASLFMSLESVFAALAGYFILGERMTTREFIGCAIMFAAVLLSQMPDMKKE